MYSSLFVIVGTPTGEAGTQRRH